MSAPIQMKRIASLAGRWDVIMKVKPQAAGNWVDTTGVSTFEFILDGAVLYQVYDGIMIDRPFKGVGMFAFNRRTGLWQHTWSDNVDGGISLFEGAFSGGRLVVTGQERTGDTTILIRSTTFNIAESKFEWVLETSPDGEDWTPMMQAVYTKNGP
jgi:hypothetical protein